MSRWLEYARRHSEEPPHPKVRPQTVAAPSESQAKTPLQLVQLVQLGAETDLNALNALTATASISEKGKTVLPP